MKDLTLQRKHDIIGKKRDNIADKIKIMFQEEDGEQVELYLNDAIERGLDAEIFYDYLIKFEDIKTSHKRINMTKFLNAVEFCMYITSGLSYSDAYRKIFPKKCEGKSVAYIGAASSAYASGKLVKNVLSRVYLNQYILFIDKSIKAKMELYNIGMDESVLTRDRVAALDKFLTHIKKEEENIVINNNLTINGQNIVDAIEKRLDELSNKTVGGIEKGIIDVETVSAKKMLENIKKN